MNQLLFNPGPSGNTGSTAMKGGASDAIRGGTGVFTVTCYACPRSLGSVVEYIVGQDNAISSPPAGGRQWVLYTDTTSQVKFLAGPPGNANFAGAGTATCTAYGSGHTTATVGVWDHFYAGYDGTHVFIQANTQTAATTAYSSGVAVSPATPLAVGAKEASSGTLSPYSGGIGPVGVWNATLTVGEIASLMAGMTAAQVLAHATLSGKVIAYYDWAGASLGTDATGNHPLTVVDANNPPYATTIDLTVAAWQRSAIGAGDVVELPFGDTVDGNGFAHTALQIGPSRRALVQTLQPALVFAPWITGTATTPPGVASVANDSHAWQEPDGRLRIATSAYTAPTVYHATGFRILEITDAACTTVNQAYWVELTTNAALTSYYGGALSSTLCIVASPCRIALTSTTGYLLCMVQPSTLDSNSDIWAIPYTLNPSTGYSMAFGTPVIVTGTVAGRVAVNSGRENNQTGYAGASSSIDPYISTFVHSGTTYYCLTVRTFIRGNNGPTYPASTYELGLEQWFSSTSPVSGYNTVYRLYDHSGAGLGISTLKEGPRFLPREDGLTGWELWYDDISSGTASVHGYRVLTGATADPLSLTEAQWAAVWTSATAVEPATWDGNRIRHSDPILLTRSVAPATVTSVVVTPSTATVAAGGTVQLSATVNGTNSPPQGATWTASGAGAVNSSGLVTAPNPFTAPFTVTATSVEDPSKSGTATISPPVVVGSKGAGMNMSPFQFGF